MTDAQEARIALFNKVLDDAYANGGTVHITFTADSIKCVSELMLRFVTNSVVTLPPRQEIDLRRRMASGNAEGCAVDANLTTTFPKRRHDFERRVLPGVAELSLIEKPPPT